MRICAYVQEQYAKQNYVKECFNTRIFAGLSVVIDILRRAGYEIEWASSVNVHKFDVVLVSITSDCDWWSFIAERETWNRGNYKVIVGGAGVLNVRPFLRWVDYFLLGRAEGVIDDLITAIEKGDEFNHKSVICSKTFDVDNKYYINQVDKPYEHEIRLENGQVYKESQIGCNHKCLFCGYTWQRKFTGGSDVFKYGDLWTKNDDVERALLDINNGIEVNYNKLRTTAIDGMSQRIRFMVNKKITREMLVEFMIRLAKTEKPHQVKFYNIIGYPTETTEDWFEFLDDIRKADSQCSKQEKQLGILLHSTPFRAMPATPLACKPMSYSNYRKEIARVLGQGKYKGNIFYQGNAIWAVESMGTESLCSVIQSAVVWRGTESDSENILKISLSKKFNSESSFKKQIILEKLFDVKKLFGGYTLRNLPTRYLQTYCSIEKLMC